MLDAGHCDSIHCLVTWFITVKILKTVNGLSIQETTRKTTTKH